MEQLQRDTPVVIVEIGTDLSDRRVMVQTPSGKKGWVSVETGDGVKILRQDKQVLS